MSVCWSHQLKTPPRQEASMPTAASEARAAVPILFHELFIYFPFLDPAEQPRPTGHMDVRRTIRRANRTSILLLFGSRNPMNRTGSRANGSHINARSRCLSKQCTVPVERTCRALRISDPPLRHAGPDRSGPPRHAAPRPVRRRCRTAMPALSKRFDISGPYSIAAQSPHR